ncbi:MAG TPA: F0F1 ATP synthase subunit B [Gemmatimonadaceae bacterium]|jgi:F-type H+-transporting ATPase subunit b
MTLFTYAALLAQEAPAAEHTYGITDIEINLMFWTLIVFGITFFIVWKFFMPKIFAAVEAREKALEKAIDDAKRDRDAAAKLLAEHQAAIEAAKGDAQKLIADARAVGEKMRAELLETTRKEQGEMLDRARRDIETEKDKAIVMLRREAVEMAILGAGRVIEENLDSDKNRKLVDGYLASIATNKVKS